MRLTDLALIGIALLAVPLCSADATGSIPSLDIAASFERVDKTQVMCTIEVSDLSSDKLIFSPRLVTQIAHPATAKGDVRLGDLEYQLEVLCEVDELTARFRVTVSDEAGTVLTESGRMSLGTGVCAAKMPR